MRRSDIETVPILLYHRVVPAGQFDHAYDISAHTFEQHLVHLRASGYRTACFAEYLAALRAGKWRTEEKRVILTFDDAPISYHRIVLPLLMQYGFRAVFFIPTAHLDRGSDQLGLVELSEMRDAGMEIQSHGHSHAFLSQLAPDELREELVRSRTVLEEQLESPVRILACPGGRYNGRVLRMASEVGYLGVCTSRPGHGAHSPREDLRVFDRLVVHERTPRPEFRGFLDKRTSLMRKKKLSYQLRVAIRSVLGQRLYHAVWSSLSRWRSSNRHPR